VAGRIQIRGVTRRDSRAVARPIRGYLHGDSTVYRPTGRLHLGQIAIGLFENAKHIEGAAITGKKESRARVSARICAVA
jgi:hypothetical protein